MFEWVLAFLRNPTSPALHGALRALPPAEQALLLSDAEYYVLDGLSDLVTYGCGE